MVDSAQKHNRVNRLVGQRYARGVSLHEQSLFARMIPSRRLEHHTRYVNPDASPDAIVKQSEGFAGATAHFQHRTEVGGHDRAEGPVQVVHVFLCVWFLQVREIRIGDAIVVALLNAAFLRQSRVREKRNTRRG